MHTIIKVALTVVAVAAIAWPILFWGQPALPEQDRRSFERSQKAPIYNTMWRDDIYW
jgi:hypothetical protein